MDIGNMLAELRLERDQVIETIMSIERLATGNQKRRGRPPAWIVAARQAVPTAKKRGRPQGSKNTPKKERS
jgi:hypothetical protein